MEIARPQQQARLRQSSFIKATGDTIKAPRSVTGAITIATLAKAMGFPIQRSFYITTTTGTTTTPYSATSPTTTAELKFHGAFQTTGSPGITALTGRT